MNFSYYYKTIAFVFFIPLLCSFGGVRLKNFDVNPNKAQDKEGVIFEKRENDIVTIKYANESNCCFKFKGEIKYTNDTLYLITIPSGKACRSLCWYEYNYTIKGIRNDNYVVKFIQKPIN
ncbi:MAG: hypothetical protein WBM13_10010 [Bacteroidia bacterium]